MSDSELYQKAKDLYKSDNPANALELSKKISTNFDLLSVQLLQASCYEDLKQYATALSLYEKVCASNSSHFEANFGIARCCHQTASVTTALDHFIRCMELRPNNPDVLVCQGDFLRDTKNSLHALQCYQRAAEIEPLNTSTHLKIVQLLLTENKKDLAAQYIGRWYQKFDAAKLAAAASSFLVADMMEVCQGLINYGLRLDTECAPCYIVYGNFMMRQKKFSDALEYFRRAIQISETVEAVSKLAEVQMHIGQVLEAEVRFARACELAPNDPTRVFNHAQCIEHTGDVSRASEYLLNYIKSVPREQMTTVNHFAMYLLAVKLLFVLGDFVQLASLITTIATFPPLVMNVLKALKAPWAYFFFITRMVLLSPIPNEPPTPSSEPEEFFVVGDSHSLVLAHRFIQLQGRRRKFVPKLVTGLKAYHLKQNLSYVTVTNLRLLLQQIPKSTKELILVCGELDCRDGIPQALAKRIYETEEEAVKKTAEVFALGVSSLSSLLPEKIRIIVHCVPPPANPEHVQRARLVRLWNKTLAQLFPRNFLDVHSELATEDGFLRLNFSCDGTHVNPQYLPMLEQHLDKLVVSLKY